ncbi:hypothetical protein FSP39_018620 [Pinctada imbricata]|uniref:Uncharacterized protein n=1 Tax=Pinctada imbricata TaxID=66713 RepID=A0AA88YXK2_PINIB|nr:hypothetical protein FSP39_018620 [Pinctada imbricata]
MHNSYQMHEERTLYPLRKKEATTDRDVYFSVQALWGETHPEYLKYIYLIAPISVVFLNPIGFALLETQKRKLADNENLHDATKGASKVPKALKLLLHVIKGVVTNPIVFMTMIGLVGNFIFSQKIPHILSDILSVFGNAFNAAALFYLGLSMVGKIKRQVDKRMIVPLLLIAVKAFLLPLVTWHAVGNLEKLTSSNNATSMSMFGFMYGTFPTAPSVFLYASQYSTATDLIAMGMVAGTFLSALLMFISAKMMAMAVDRQLFYTEVLLDAACDISIVSVVCCAWVVVILILSRRIKGILHQFLFCLIISHALSCIGMIIYHSENSVAMVKHYLHFCVIQSGILAARCWTAIISLCLYLLHSRGHNYVTKIRWALYFLGFGVVLFNVSLLLSTASNSPEEEVHSVFHDGTEQTILSVVILLLCSIVTITSMVLNHRKQRQVASNGTEETKTEPDLHIQEKEKVQDLHIHETEEDISCNVRIENNNEHNKDGNYQSVYTICFNCPGRKYYSQELERSYNGEQEESQRSQPEERDYNVYIGNDETVKEANKINYQSNRFTLLLVTMQLSMFIGLFLCTWRLLGYNYSGIYVEIEFIDGVFNYGQGIIILAIFGFDSKIIFIPCLKRWRRLLYGAESLHLPSKDKLKKEVKQICQQFKRHHKEKCEKDIVKDLK